jgi:hypothetical protein
MKINIKIWRNSNVHLLIMEECTSDMDSSNGFLWTMLPLIRSSGYQHQCVEEMTHLLPMNSNINVMIQEEHTSNQTFKRSILSLLIEVLIMI